MIMILFVFFIIGLIGCEDIDLEGKVAVLGNEPHTYLALITDDHGDFKIVGKLEKKIWDNYQQIRIRVKGNIIKEGIGPGFPPELEVTKVIEVK